MNQQSKAPAPEPFVTRRAIPVAGPGIERKAVHGRLNENEEEPEAPAPPQVAAPNDAPKGQRRSAARNTVVRERRTKAVMLDLSTMLMLLETVKPEERTHITAIVKVLNDLPSGARKRVLDFIVKVFT